MENDNRVFLLAEKIKQDNIELREDYLKGANSKDFYLGCIADSEVLLDYMEQIWGVNLDDYYVGVRILD